MRSIVAWWIGAALVSAGTAAGQCQSPETQVLVAPQTNANDHFGISAAMTGSYLHAGINDVWAVIGARNDDHSALTAVGSARVYRMVNNAFVHSATLIPSDPASGDQFGYSVDMDGDRIIVGAIRADSPTIADTGAAYIFVRSGETWVQEAKFLASDGAANDSFGISVAISGDVAVVGAYFHDPPAGTNAGAVYIYRRSGGGVWSLEQKITPPDLGPGMLFGQSVDAGPNRIIVGCPLDNDLGTSSGSVYVYVFSGGVWVQQQKLLASDGASGLRFGTSVSMLYPYAIIGADQGGTGTGKAYIVRDSAGNWQLEAILAPPVPNNGARFGTSVALGLRLWGPGYYAVVGAFSYDLPGANNAGSAFVYKRSTTTGQWDYLGHLAAPDASADDTLGFSVAALGEVFIAGAYLDDTPGNSNIGTARAFRASGPPLIRQPIPQVRIEGRDAHFSAFGDPSQTMFQFGSYMWLRNGEMIPGEHEPSPGGGMFLGQFTHSLIVTDVAPADQGEYRCVYLDNCGTILSEPATLTVVPPPTGGDHCPGDADNNGTVTFADITSVLASFNTMCP